MSRVSVIVPVLNEADTLAESLARLRAALADGDELMIAGFIRTIPRRTTIQHVRLAS